MRIFKTKWFDEFADKNVIHDAALIEAVERAEKGLVDADLGGGVIKQRVARDGQGRSRGHRVIILLRKGDRAFIVFGFSKNDQSNLRRDDQKDLKDMAKSYFSLSEIRLSEYLAKGDFVEIRKNG